MIATILKSPKATETTLAIIETFTKVREIGRTIQGLTKLPEGSVKQKSLMHRAGERKIKSHGFPRFEVYIWHDFNHATTM